MTLPDILVMLRPSGIMEVLGTKLGGETPREGGRDADFFSTTKSRLFRIMMIEPLNYNSKKIKDKR